MLWTENARQHKTVTARFPFKVFRRLLFHHLNGSTVVLSYDIQSVANLILLLSVYIINISILWSCDNVDAGGISYRNFAFLSYFAGQRGEGMVVNNGLCDNVVFNEDIPKVGWICNWNRIIIHTEMFSLHSAYIPNSVNTGSILAFWVDPHRVWYRLTPTLVRRQSGGRVEAEPTWSLFVTLADYIQNMYIYAIDGERGLYLSHLNHIPAAELDNYLMELCALA